MKSSSLLSTSLLLALMTAAGCASDAADDPRDEGGGGPNNPTPQQPVPTTPEGRFQVQSEFDLATNLPGTVGTVVNYFIDATNDRDDPTRFILDKVVGALPEGSIKNQLRDLVPFVAGTINDRVLQIAPNFVGKMIQVGNAFGQVTRKFGTTELLEIDAAGGAVKTVQGLHFTIDNVDMEFAFANYRLPETRLEGLTVTLEKNGRLAISQHKVGLRYGQILKIALDEAIIPLIDPSASNLGELLRGLINCQAVGVAIYNAVNFGSASTFESACNNGLTAGAGLVYSRLNAIDSSAVEFGLTGTARGVDKNRDGKMDDITVGSWTGNLTYAGTPAPLGDARFFGERQ